jgi:hypothetical protein
MKAHGRESRRAPPGTPIVQQAPSQSWHVPAGRLLDE